jgi:CRISPR-associated protein Csm5
MKGGTGMIEDRKWTYDIEVLSPLHIGAGERISRADFISDGGRMSVVDIDRLLRQPRVRPDFLVHKLGETNQVDIGEVVRAFGIRPTYVARYTIPCPMRLGREVMVAQKTAFDEPYLPGSSLKGAIRTALVWKAFTDLALWQQAEQQVLKNTDRVRYMVAGADGWRCKRRLQESSKNSIADGVEEIYLGEDPKCDLLRSLQISDSTPLPVNRLEVVEVKTLSRQRGGHHGWKQWRLYPEVLPEGIQLTGSLKISEYLFAETSNVQSASELGFDAPRQELVRSFAHVCREYTREHIEAEHRFYAECGLQDVANWYQDELLPRVSQHANVFPLQLGWGTGRQSKVIPQLRATHLEDKLRWALNLGKFVCNTCEAQVRPDDYVGNRWYCSGCNKKKKRDEVSLVRPYPKTRRLALVDRHYRPMGWVLVRLTGEE